MADDNMGKEIAHELIRKITPEELEQNTQTILSELDIKAEDVIKKGQDFCNKYIEFQGYKKNPENIEALLNQEKIMYQTFFDFQNSFNTYLGQKIQMVMVFESENGEYQLGLIDNDAEHLKAVDVGYGKKATQRLAYAMDKINTYLENTKDYDSSGLQATYNSTLYRYKIGSRYRFKKRGMVPVLWKIANVWDGRFILNKGTLAEAYANFYINKIDFNTEQNLEVKVANFITNENYGAMKVDNTSGFILGDVSNINSPSIQYAIKSANASAMQVNQVFHIFQQLLRDFATASNTDYDLLLKTLADAFREEGNIKQVQTIEEQTGEQIDNLLEIRLFKNLTRNLTRKNIVG